MRKFWILTLALGCGGTTNVVDGDKNDQQGGGEEDEIGPVIEHDEIDDLIVRGEHRRRGTRLPETPYRAENAHRVQN